MKSKQTQIQLTKAEIQSGLTRQKQAENLILQLPDNHDGRNSWLLNYGTGDLAQYLRYHHTNSPRFIQEYQAAETG